MSILYLSGPMSGLPDYNRLAFHQAATQLEAAGYTVINPATISMRDGWKWADYMRSAIKLLMEAEAVATLGDWTGSRGAVIEVDLAHELGMIIRPWRNWL